MEKSCTHEILHDECVEILHAAAGEILEVAFGSQRGAEPTPKK